METVFIKQLSSYISSSDGSAIYIVGLTLFITLMFYFIKYGVPILKRIHSDVSNNDIKKGVDVVGSDIQELTNFIKTNITSDINNLKILLDSDIKNLTIYIETELSKQGLQSDINLDKINKLSEGVNKIKSDISYLKGLLSNGHRKL